MDSSTLRIVLIVIGVLLILGILLFGSPEQRKRRHASRSERQAARKKKTKTPAFPSSDVDPEDDETGVQQELEQLGDMIRESRLTGLDDAAQAEAGPANADQSRETASKPKGPPPPPPDRIISLFVRQQDNRAITGVKLLDAALKAGLEFGEMDIFHRHQETTGKKLFSMANLVKPGTFDKSQWNLFETPGVTLFMTLPGPLDGLAIWDTMLATAQRLSELLKAELLDEQQVPLSRQRIAEIRESLREYDREQAIKAASFDP